MLNRKHPPTFVAHSSQGNKALDGTIVGSLHGTLTPKKNLKRTHVPNPYEHIK